MALGGSGQYLAKVVEMYLDIVVLVVMGINQRRD